MTVVMRIFKIFGNFHVNFTYYVELSYLIRVAISLGKAGQHLLARLKIFKIKFIFICKLFGDPAVCLRDAIKGRNPPFE